MASVAACRARDAKARRRFTLLLCFEGLRELVDKHRNTGLKLFFRRIPLWPSLDLIGTSGN
jgi:hypothetical protein